MPRIIDKLLLLLIAVALSLASGNAGPAETRNPGLAPKVGAELSVCVFCGASEKVDPKYRNTAARIGRGIAERRWVLVYGGGEAGLMGTVARAARDGHGRVVGVLPEFITAMEKPGNLEDERITVATMHERKGVLQARSDAFVILPGGTGTLDELADTLCLRQLGQHNKPIILVNEDGYYDPLLAFLDRSVGENFSRENLRDNLLVVRQVDEVFAYLEQLRYPARVVSSP